MKTSKKNHSLNTFTRLLVIAFSFFLFSSTISAQEIDAYERTKKEIVDALGMMPIMFKVYPKHALAGAWENYKQMNSPKNVIPPKYRELIGLAVSSQIPCEYCIYYHTVAAKSFGATDKEIQEAIAHGAQSRLWSTILKGNQVDLDTFKKESEMMMKHMSENPKK